MDLCHSKNAELAKHLQEYKRQPVLRRDNVKDEGRYRAVFTEQGVSVSQMAAAKFLDAMSKLLGMAGETSDAISAYTRVKMTEAPRLLRMPKEECPEMWIRIPPRQIPTGWDNIEDPSGTSWKKLMWSPTGRPCLGKKIWRSDIRKRMGGKYQLGECLYVHKKLGFFSSVYVDDIKNGWKGATQWTHVDNSAERNRPRISNAIDRSSVFGLHAKRGKGWSSGSSFRNRLVQEIDDDKGGWRKKTKRKKNIRWKRSLLGAPIWKVMPNNALKDSAKKQKMMYLLPSRWQRLAWTITWYLRKTVRQPETSLQYVLRLFWNALYSASIGRTDFSWSVNTLARPVTKWIKDCDKWLLRLINYVNQTKNFIQFCHVVNQIEDCKLGLFQDASFAGDVRDLKINVRRFTVRVWTTHVCSNFVDVHKKQTAVSHSSAESDFLTRRRFTCGWITSSSIWWMCLGKTYPVSQPRETLSVTQAKESFRLTHILTICLWVN